MQGFWVYTLGALCLLLGLILVWGAFLLKSSRRSIDTLEKHVSFWYESTKEIVLLFGVEGRHKFRLLAINGAAERYLAKYGNKEAGTDIIGKDLKDILIDHLWLSAPEADYKISQYQIAADQKETYAFDEQNRVPNLGEIITQTRIRPIFNDKEVVTQLCYTAFDISAFRKAVQKSKESNELLEEAQQIAQIGVWQWNAEINVFDWSPKMKEIFGLELDETPNFGQWLSMIHPDDENRIRKEIESAFAEHSSFSLDHKIIKKDGAIRYVNTWGGLRISDKGEVREVFGLCRDRTDEKEAEDRLLAAVIKAEDDAREGIARELHDGLGQSLTTILLNLNTLSREREKLSPKGQDRLKIALEFLDLSIVESRKIAHTLMPQVVIEFGFVLAVQNLIDALQNDKLEFYFFHQLEEGFKLSQKWEVSLYRICQEAIQNIIKHAAASEVSIQLTQDEDSLQLTIEDNGIGFELDTLQSEGLGINNIRMRTQALGGVFFVDSKPSKGSLLTIQIPTNTYVYGSMENTHR